MLLKDYLNGHTKEQLLDYARDFELKNCSGLRKAALVERIKKEYKTCLEDQLLPSHAFHSHSLRILQVVFMEV